MSKKTRDWKVLFGFLVLVFFIEILGGLFTQSSVTDWYQTLNRPAWTPPDWLFGPAWTILYILMAISAWIVYCEKSTRLKTVALTSFFVQLFLNLCWSALFFTAKSPLLGLLDIILLWIMIVSTTVLFWKVKPLAGILFIPYLAWTSYALALNAAIFVLN